MPRWRATVKKGSPFPNFQWTVKVYLDGVSKGNFSYATHSMAMIRAIKILNELNTRYPHRHNWRSSDTYFALAGLSYEITGCGKNRMR